MLPPAEKIPRQGSEGIPLPEYFGNLLEYFGGKVRPRLKPNEGTIAMWINNNGRPVGKKIKKIYL